MRIVFQTELVKATALAITDMSISRGKIAPCAGLASAASAPTMMFQAITVQMSISPATTSVAIKNVSCAVAAWLITRMRRVSKRSATIPAGTLSTIVGSADASPTTPNQIGERSSSTKTSHAVPMKRNCSPKTRATIDIQ